MTNFNIVVPYFSSILSYIFTIDRLHDMAGVGLTISLSPIELQTRVCGQRPRGFYQVLYQARLFLFLIAVRKLK